MPLKNSNLLEELDRLYVVPTVKLFSKLFENDEIYNAHVEKMVYLIP